MQIKPIFGMRLRDYQQQASDATLALINSGKNSPLVVLPPSMGKTHIAIEIYLKLLQQKDHVGKLLWISHTGELLEQAYKSFQAVAPNLKYGFEKASLSSEDDCDIVFATIQTMQNDRMKKFMATRNIGIIVCDEAHHSAAKSYQSLFAEFRSKDKDGVILGITATPDRSDSKEIRSFYNLAYEMSLAEAVRESWQPKLLIWSIKTDSDLSDVKVRSGKGDYLPSSLSHAVNTLNRNAGVVKSYFALEKRIKRPPNSIVFAADVAHAKDLSKAFNDNGIKAEFITGDMPEKERKDIVERFRNNEFHVLTNVNCASEGFDIPSLDAVFLARPSFSQLLITQQIGRITRLSSDISSRISLCSSAEERAALIESSAKREVHVFDFVDVSERLDINREPVRVATILGIDPHFTYEGDVVKKVRANIEAAQMLGADISAARSLKDVTVAMRLSKIIAAPSRSKSDFLKITQLSAMALSDGNVLLIVPGKEREFYRIEKTALDNWRVLYGISGQPMKILSSPNNPIFNLPGAFMRLENFLEKHRPHHYEALLANSAWRNENIKEIQIKFLRSHNLPIPKTRGEAANIINQNFMPEIIAPPPMVISKTIPKVQIRSGPITDNQYNVLLYKLRFSPEDIPKTCEEAYKILSRKAKVNNAYRRYSR